MKKIIFILVIIAIAGVAGVMTYRKYGHMLQNAEILPTPSVDSGFLRLVNTRAASRNFSAKEIDKETLSEILWTAYGKNARGTRTIPTARNEQNLKVYAILANGAFLYDGEKLNQVSDQDLRPLFAKQGFVMTAPLTLLFVGSDKTYSAMHAGSSYQNVALYSAEKGLGNVVRGMFDHAAVEKALGLGTGEALISQTIGWVE